MQGDLNVDLLMLPVLHAIERHVKDRDAITDIYNRAYEAVMTSMDVNKERAEKAEAKLKSITERCEELESRLDLYHGNMMDVLQDALHKATEKITFLESSLSALRERTRWIPVSEKLPLPAQKRDGYMSDSSELVHVYPSPKNDRAVCYLHYLEKWSCSAEVTPTHWRPIDLPHEGE